MSNNMDFPSVPFREDEDEEEPLSCTPYRTLQAAAKKLNIPANLKKQYLVDLITARELGNETVVRMLFDSAQKEKFGNDKECPNALRNSSEAGKTSVLCASAKKAPAESEKKSSLEIDGAGVEVATASCSNQKHIDDGKGEVKRIHSNDVKREIIDAKVSDENLKSSKNVTSPNENAESNSKIKSCDISLKKIERNENKKHKRNSKLNAFDGFLTNEDPSLVNSTENNPVFALTDDTVTVKEPSIGNLSKIVPLPNSEIDMNLKCTPNETEIRDKMTPSNYSKLHEDRDHSESIEQSEDPKMKNKLDFYYNDDNIIMNADVSMTGKVYPKNQEFLPSISTVTSVASNRFYKQDSVTNAQSLPDEQMKMLNSLLNTEPLQNMCDQQSEFLNIADMSTAIILNKHNFCDNPVEQCQYFNNSDQIFLNTDSIIDQQPSSEKYIHESFSECDVSTSYLATNSHDTLQDYSNIETDDYSHFADTLVDNFTSFDTMHFSPPNSSIRNLHSNAIIQNPRCNSNDDSESTYFINKYGTWKELFQTLNENPNAIICFMCNWLGYTNNFYGHIKHKHSKKICHAYKGMVTVYINILKLASGLHPDQQQTIIQHRDVLYVLRLKFKPPDVICAVMLKLPMIADDSSNPSTIHIRTITEHTKRRLHWKGTAENIIDPSRPAYIDIFSNKKQLFEIKLRDLEMIPHDVNENNINLHGLNLSLYLLIQTKQDLESSILSLHAK